MDYNVIYNAWELRGSRCVCVCVCVYECSECMSECSECV